jgi:AcrR family transcriptional regulator
MSTVTGGRSLDVREAALSLFAERGYHGTTMNDIAGELGMRAPSLYNHVPSKQEILRDIMVETQAALLEEFDRAVAGAQRPEQRLEHAIEAFVLHHLRHRREALVGNREVSSLEEPARTQVLDGRRRHVRSIRALIDEGREASVFDVGDPTVAAFTMLEMSVATARWFRDDGPLSAEEVARQYGEFALRIAGADVSGDLRPRR